MNHVQLKTDTTRNVFIPQFQDGTVRSGRNFVKKIPGQFMALSPSMTSVPASGFLRGYGVASQVFIGLDKQAATVRSGDALNFALERARGEIVSQSVQVLKNQKAIELLKSWVGDGQIDEEQKRALECLEKSLDEDRFSSRKLFP